MLAGAYFDHRGALRASLRAEYLVDLRNPGMCLYDLADLVAHLPPGCALWRSTGGDYAWTQEAHMLASVELGVRGLQWQHAGNKNAPKPEPWEPPQLASVRQEEEMVTSRRADRYLKRQRAR